MDKDQMAWMPLAGLLVTLLLAYALDQFNYFQRLAFARQMDFLQFIGSGLAVGFFLIVIWGFFAWVSLARGERSILLSVLFVGAGILVYAYPYLQQTSRAFPLIFKGYQTPLAYTGLFIAAIGALRLVWRKA